MPHTPTPRHTGYSEQKRITEAFLLGSASHAKIG
jgi:hypothetical protein